jgi:hypothetical protein
MLQAACASEHGDCLRNFAAASQITELSEIFGNLRPCRIALQSHQHCKAELLLNARQACVMSPVATTAYSGRPGMKAARDIHVPLAPCSHSWMKKTPF